MMTEQTILSRGLPKTDQTVVYQSGDDGSKQAGWWMGLTIAANRVRFEPKTIGSDVILRDNATGLIWVQDGNSSGAYNGNAIKWTSAIAYLEALDFAGFTDWRLPNVMELFSIMRFLGGADGFYPEFDNIKTADSYWSSTTYPLSTNFKYMISFNTRIISIAPRDNTIYILGVRGGV